ncbi:hypothetical protein EV363DRAFT_1451295 [Boletus edulis]|nr:hypothetical protein EV363DRAFT_1451295 [Boletus edulis]
MFCQQFTENSFPVRYCNSSPYAEDLRCRIQGDALPTEPLHMKVVLFELQCPVSFEAWRSSTIRILDFFCDWKLFDTDTDRLYLANSIPISKVPGLQRYAVRHDRALISLANFSEDKLLYVIYDDHKPRKLPQELNLRDLGRFTYEIPSGPYEQKYLTATTHTSNEVLSAQADCQMDLSLHEFIAFAHLRSGGSLQWMNILRELHSRSLNFRRPEVHLLFAQASTQLGPLADTGELIWHQELQDDSFCHALLDELESLFFDVGVGSSDGPVMGTITLIASLLASGPSEAISERSLQLLPERAREDIRLDPDIMHKLLHSAQDVEIALACALLMRALVPPNFPSLDTPSYSRVLLERDRHLSYALEEVLRNAILADATNFGVDLAVSKGWPGYRPGTGHSQLVQVNLLDGSALVDGWRVGERLPSTITGHPVYRVIFGDQNFGVVPSDLPEMDFVTLFMISEHDVHFSLQDDRLVIRAQHKDTEDILELIPQEQLRRDLPAFLIKGHAHWLNHATHIIEIRPLKKLWEPFLDNWRINLASKPCRITKGKESLVDIHSPTWLMVSRCLRGLDISENLIITVSSHVDMPQSSPSLQLSVTLPRYGLSFFVNEDGDLESRDFKDMVCDENQCIGTLSGLGNRLILRPKRVNPPLDCMAISLSVMIVPPEYPEDTWAVTDSHRPDNVLYHVYNVDGTLGCLTGVSSLTSRLYLAFLHAMTNNACRPDPLTDRTGIEEAISLTWLAADSLKNDSSTLDCGEILPTSHIPDHLQLGIAIDKIGLDHPFRTSLNIGWDAVLQETYLYPSEIVAQLPEEEQSNVQPRHAPLEDDLVYTVASVVDRWSLNAPIVNDLSSWAEAWGDTIVGDDPSSQLEALRSDPSVTPLRMKIYNLLAKGGSTGDRETRRIQLLFSLPEMVYSSKNPQGTLLSTLVAFAKQPHVHSENLPRSAEYNILAGYHPEDRQIRRHLSAAYSGGGSSWNIDFDAEMQQLLRSWPSEKAVTASLDPVRFNVAVLNAGLQPLFSSWYRNFKLKEYLTRVCGNPTPLPSNPATCVLERSFDWHVTLDQLLRERSAPDLPPCHRLPHRRVGSNLNGVSPSDTAQLSRLFSSLPASGEASEFQKQYVARLRASARHVGAEEPTGSAVKPGIETLVEHYVLCQSVYMESMEIAKKALGPRTQIERLLDRGGQWPRATPYVLFRCLASTSPIKLPGNWKKCLISLALLALEVQRARRLLQFSVQNLEEEFFKELENEGGDGWIAAEYPDWLLIQLQGNFLIRRVQVDVAKEMMNPRSTKNTVIQVNMGEGKSSVIIPICAAALANTHQLVRVIVPRALKAQMLQLLTNRLGGLVGMSIHHFTLSRSSSQPSVTTIQEIMNKHGVLVMTLEDVLALKLNCVDRAVHTNVSANSSSVVRKLEYEQLLTERLLSSLTENTYVATVFGFMNRWICTKKLTTKNRDIKENHSEFQLESDRRKISRAVKELQSYFCLHARDILDESDEILHPRFQMIYTIGHPLHLEGFPGRWAITQRVLRLVNRHASIHSTLIPHEIQCDSVHSGFGSFPRMHIVKTDSEKQFIPLIAEDVVRGRVVDLGIQYLPQQLQHAIYDFISLKDILPETTRIVEEYARHTTSWDALLLLRGLLAENILLFALTGRRWRVDYGLDPSRTMLAVPYRAKDVPAARAEFGHPDLTIVLTCLSYYYGGLSEEQLRISFEILLEQDDPFSDYAIWLEDCACGTSADALRDLSTINIRSSTQWEQYISPLFSWNQGAIDFYLSKVVFPKHAKEYPWKISGSSWDIAEQRNHLVTGFSGTNDAQYLLPTSIHQDEPDYLHQTGTNARVLANILHVDNNHHIVTTHENGERWSTRDLLRTIVAQEPKIRVLLDVGAQVLDLSNRALAETWLDLTLVSDTAGAIYFNEDDVLVILTRNDSVQPLLSSPLAQHIDRCVTYLDDVHTRGTDIKFPHGFRAAVTLGAKVTKDRLAQGCMRMRKLGHGHSVMFFVPPEVDCKIRWLSTKDSQAITTTNILHWAIRETWSDIQRWAPHWAQQGMSHKSRHEALSRFLRDELTSEQLATSWLQPEIKSLAELYAPRYYPNTTHSLELDLDIRQRCKSLGISSLPSACLDEEQEREVSREIERERQTVRPPKATPAEHSLHPDVVEFVRTGVLRLEPRSTAFRPVFTTLSNSSAATGSANTFTSILYSPRTTKRMKSSDDLKLYSIPPLPSDWTPPWALIDQLNVFAGQLYLRDYPSYVRLCRFLGVHTEDLPDGTTPILRNWLNPPGSFEPEIELTFDQSPLPFVMMLLAIRNRGMPFAKSHMGSILRGQLLTEKDFQDPAPPIVHYVFRDGYASCPPLIAFLFSSSFS